MTNCGASCDEFKQLEAENIEMKKVLNVLWGSTEVEIGINWITTHQKMLAQYTNYGQGWFNSLIKALKKYEEYERKNG